MNKVTLLGFVEQEPELRRAADGRAVASFAVTTSRRRNTDPGIDGSATEWFSVVAWGELAEAAQAHLTKNQRLYAEGHLQTRSWDDSDGQRHTRTEVVATRLIPMDTREEIAARGLGEGASELPLSLNKILVIGNLGRDPEMRYTPDGQAVTSFSLAATRTGAASSGVHSGTAEWFNVVAWGSLAELCNQHLARGRRVYIEGELRTRGWEQPTGTRRFRTELIADEMIMLGPRPKDRSAEHGSTTSRDDSSL